MHYGVVSADLEPNLIIALLGVDNTIVEVDCAIDTGFTEEMTLPPDIIEALGLPINKQVELTLADETIYVGTTYVARLRWYDQIRNIEVISVDADPLIGMKLLAGSNLSIDAEPGGAVIISEL